MLQVRKAEDRGHFNHGWLDTYHAFSFGDYRDPQHMHFRDLRVMNEDVVAPGRGFGMHPHRDMEIITYVLSGSLQHNDSMGNGSVITPGEFQRMSAGTGITHSEANPSATEPVHLYQIWLFPAERGIRPSYEQRRFAEAERADRLRLVASQDGRDESLLIHQNAEVYLATLSVGRELSYKIRPHRHAWLQVLRGGVSLNGIGLAAGDGAAVSDETNLVVEAAKPSEIMLFDLA
jgi:redox-sensitive bicupin YhaK (pirin superfamily)